MMNYLNAKEVLPPVIVGYADGEFEINCNNPLFEALVREGVTYFPVIMWTTRKSDYDDFVKKHAPYTEFQMYGSTAHQQKAIYELDLTVPLLLFIGNETKGLSYAYKEMCDELCTIPMAETSTASSFNVSCAASIMMYEVVRQRRG